MSADSANAAEVSRNVLSKLVSYFEVDGSFLRHNDHEIHASQLIAEWPPRPDIPDPDPLAFVAFDDADPISALFEHGKKPAVFRPRPASDDFQRRIQDNWQIRTQSMAIAPLLSGETTTGVLGFVKFGDRAWQPNELNALEAIASLFAQLQAKTNAEEQLRYLAEHDDLTGMLNRRSLLAYLDSRLAPDRSGAVVLLFLDLDRMKVINDYLGHMAGDKFIRAVAERLRQQVGESAFLARLGGDEFVVVPRYPMGTTEAESLASELHGALCDRVEIDGEMLTRTVSIGIAVGRPGSDRASDLLRRADQAALTAKNAGGSQIATFTHAMSMHSDFRNDIELHLEDAIGTEALTLHYLPEVDIRSGDILAVEALLRWQHPVWGLLSPESFIGVAESIHLASELGCWVIREACSDLSRWRHHGVGGDVQLRLNVSPVQLVAAGFVRSVAGILNEFGIEGSAVCLEITESIVVQDIETTRITLAGLKELGVHTAIDDFGTGYSVLSHLKDLPVDMLKIDKGFVHELGRNAGDLAIVRAIIALATAFGLELVAEGVETEEAARTLTQHGCNRGQGFLFSRPLPRDEMETLLAAGRIAPRLISDPRHGSGHPAEGAREGEEPAEPTA